MDIISNREEMVFKNEKDGKISYSIGISKKDINNNYVNGYVPVRFKKGIEPTEKQTKIKIKNAWLDFFKIEKRTIPFIFINDYDKVETQQNTIQQNNTTQQGWDSAKDIEIPQEELPFY